MELNQMLREAQAKWESGQSFMLAGHPIQVASFLKLICTIRYPDITAEDMADMEREHSN